MPTNPTLATVNGEAIKKSELKPEVLAMKNFYTFLKQKNPHITEEALNYLIDQKIIEDYVAQHHITVSDEELQKQYQQAVKSVGNEQAYLKKFQDMYHIDKNVVLGKIKLDLLRQKIQALTHIPSEEWLEQERKEIPIEINYNALKSSF